MRVITDLDTLDLHDCPSPRCLTLGVFDGLHCAHQALVRRCVEDAGEKGSSIVFTFSNHPLSVLAPAYEPRKLLSTDRKRQVLKRLGVDVLVLLEFSRELADMAPQAFLEKILEARCRVDRLVVGFDFRFGRDAQGCTTFLEEVALEKDIAFEVAPALYHNEWPVSSTRIRETIEEGHLRLAMEMLGRPYELAGPVIHGFGRGTALGYPTANIVFDPAFAAPASGVYAVYVVAGKEVWPGMMNIGSSPTFEGTEYRPEVFLLDYSGGSLYDRDVRVFFIERIREERKFPSPEALVERIKRDEEIARALLLQRERPDFFL